MTILEKILEVKKLEVADLLEQQIPFELTKTTYYKPSLFETLYNTQHLQVISEIKRASPSKGLIEGNVESRTAGACLRKCGAAAISVLTDQQFFKGSMSDLQAVSSAVQPSRALQRFIIHRLQIEQAKRAGALSFC